MRSQGALEYGTEHYGLIVAMHVAFLVSLLLEVSLFKPSLVVIWPFLLSVFFILQCFRVWVILSLGKYWNTKLLVIPQAKIVKKGPYKWIRHPNYLVVTFELILIPLLFQAYLTLVLFFVLNQILLSIRIPAEEAMLKQWTEYETEFEHQSRFVPSINKKE